MPWYFRRRRKVAPGVHLNIAKSGVGLSFGPHWLRFVVGPHGEHSLYCGVPRTGLYFRKSMANRPRGRVRRSRG